jgi:excisionase family DNA binding protein
MNPQTHPNLPPVPPPIPPKRAEAVSRAETALQLSVSEKTVDNLIRAGNLDTVRLGRRVLVLQRSIDKLLRPGAIYRGREVKSA